MKKKVRLIILSLALIIILSFSLSSCLGPNTRRIGEDEIIESLKNDYGITIEKEYCLFNLSKDIKEYTQFDDYQNIDNKLSKWSNNISVLYIKTDKGEDKFIYCLIGSVKKSVKENGKTVNAEIKDYIYITDFPFTYTYDDIKAQCEGIADEDIKNEMLNAFDNVDGCSYWSIYPKKTVFRTFNEEEAILINSHLVDKELIFTITTSPYYYYFFYVKEGNDIKLYIYKEEHKLNPDLGSIIYPSSMTKDEFINHLKTL